MKVLPIHSTVTYPKHGFIRWLKVRCVYTAIEFGQKYPEYYEHK